MLKTDAVSISSADFSQLNESSMVNKNRLFFKKTRNHPNHESQRLQKIK